MSHIITSKFDQKLLGFWCGARDVYNEVADSLSEETSRLHSVKAISFFVQHSYRFADASLMLAANDDLLPAVALMRTAIEAQVRANHLISFNGKEREDRAAELFRLFELSKDRISNLQDKSIRNAANVPNCPQGIREIISTLCDEPEDESEALRKERRTLEGRWKYGTLIERQSFGDQKKNLRTPFQPLQQTFDVSYNVGSFGLHPDLMSLQIEKRLSANEIVDDAAAVAVCVVHCYLVAIGKQDDSKFSQLVAEYSNYAWSKVKERQDWLDGQMMHKKGNRSAST